MLPDISRSKPSNLTWALFRLAVISPLSTVPADAFRARLISLPNFLCLIFESGTSTFRSIIGSSPVS